MTILAIQNPFGQNPLFQAINLDDISCKTLAERQRQKEHISGDSLTHYTVLRAKEERRSRGGRGIDGSSENPTFGKRDPPPPPPPLLGGREGSV